MGRSAKDATLTTIKLLELPITAEEYHNQAETLWRECFPHCKLMPGELPQLRVTTLLREFQSLDAVLNTA